MNVEIWITSTIDISLHFVAYIKFLVPLNGYSANNIKKNNTPNAHKSTEIP